MNGRKEESILQLVADEEVLQLVEKVVYNWEVAANRMVQIEKERAEGLNDDGEVEAMSVFCRMEYVYSLIYSLIGHPQAVLLRSVVGRLWPLVNDTRMDGEITRLLSMESDELRIVPPTMWERMLSRNLQSVEHPEVRGMVQDLFVNNIMPHMSREGQLASMRVLGREHDTSDEYKEQVDESIVELRELGKNLRTVAHGSRQLISMGLMMIHTWPMMVCQELDMDVMGAVEVSDKFEEAKRTLMECDRWGSYWREHKRHLEQLGPLDAQLKADAEETERCLINMHHYLYNSWNESPEAFGEALKNRPLADEQMLLLLFHLAKKDAIALETEQPDVRRQKMEEGALAAAMKLRELADEDYYMNYADIWRRIVSNDELALQLMDFNSSKYNKVFSMQCLCKIVGYLHREHHFYFLDIDEKGLTESLWNKVREENLVEEFRIVYFAESAGGGTHIWAWRTPGSTIEEDIQKLAGRLGVGYDPHVTDLARCCFMVSEKYVKLLDPVVFEPLTDEQQKMYTCEQVHRPSVNARYSTSYKGLSYEHICQRMLLKMGYGYQPVEGERNNAVFALARYLRYICDFNVEWMFQVMPRWGLPDHEVLSTLKSAVASVRKEHIPAPMADLLAVMETEMQESEAETDADDDDSLVHRVAKRLPGLLQQVADHVPEEFKEASLLAALPMLGTVATGIRARYRDGRLQSPSFIVSVWAPQATGKSFVDEEMQLLMDPIIRQDEVEWQKEIAYSLDKKDGKEAENPQSQIRIIEPNIGVAAFLERAIYAKGKHLFTYAPEIETVLKNNKGGAWTQKNDLFRLAYDNKLWGQHRISKDSFSGKVTLYYNLLMCGTPHKCRAFFADAESGLVSRTVHVELPDMLGARMPAFKPWTKEEEDEVKRQTMCLAAEEGEVSLPRLNKAIEEWDEGKRQEYLKTLQPSLDTFRRRAALNGFRAGMVAYALAGHVETDAVVEFALWVAERNLYYQLKLFGRQVDGLHGEATMAAVPARTADLLKLLSPEFTKEELVNLRIAHGQSDQVKSVIHRWKQEGLIVKIAPNLWRKCE